MTQSPGLIQIHIRHGQGNMRGPVDLIRRVEWPADPHIEYEPSDEAWGLYFGIGKLGQPLMPGDQFSLERFVDGMDGAFIVKNSAIANPMESLLMMDVEFVPLAADVRTI